MVNIRVSYQDRQELEKLIRLLRPFILSCRISKTQKGKYIKAYISLDI